MLKNAFWLFILSIIILFIFLPSYTRMQDLELKNREYLDELRVLKEKHAQLKKENIKLEQDPEYLEKVAREKMGLIREGEVVYKITPAGGE